MYPRSGHTKIFKKSSNKRTTSQLEWLPLLLISFISILASVCLLCKMIDPYLTTYVNLCHVPCPQRLVFPSLSPTCSQECLMDHGWNDGPEVPARKREAIGSSMPWTHKLQPAETRKSFLANPIARGPYPECHDGVGHKAGSRFES